MSPRADMTLFTRAFPVAVSVCLAGGVLSAARPHYGGTLRIETGSIMRHVNALAYETLVAIDAAGGVRPVLARSWTGDARGRRWTFHLRPDVVLHDGSILQPAQVAAALQALHADWQITPDADAVAIDLGHDAPGLPWELADSSNAIGIRLSAGAQIGSGPFRVERVDAGTIVLRAHDDYWDSRPFLDAIELRMRAATDQLTDLETGRADMVPIQPTDVRRVEQRQMRIEASRPLQLVVLAFEAPFASPANDAIRRTFATAIDRGAIARVVLQGRAEPADGLLPEWISGYAPFVLVRTASSMRPPAIAALAADRRTLALRVGPADPMAQAIAQRIAVNARDAGFTVNVQAPAGLGPRFDVRLLRVPFRAATPADALTDVMTGIGARTITLVGRVDTPDGGAPVETVLATERALVARDIVVPIVHVPELYALSGRVQSWNGPVVLPDGAWNLANVWVSPP
ncbi:MAG TPA: ABC transporter substrate-binding protein [Vicinamibacterales bacterium]|jgi:peptide/nickel transport system substrate-binding protein|nr:ABC transporter substrate-binding protein [Vicinamibacterales bacterium]